MEVLAPRAGLILQRATPGESSQPVPFPTRSGSVGPGPPAGQTAGGREIVCPRCQNRSPSSLKSIPPPRRGTSKTTTARTRGPGAVWRAGGGSCGCGFLASIFWLSGYRLAVVSVSVSVGSPRSRSACRHRTGAGSGRRRTRGWGIVLIRSALAQVQGLVSIFGFGRGGRVRKVSFNGAGRDADGPAKTHRGQFPGVDLSIYSHP